MVALVWFSLGQGEGNFPSNPYSPHKVGLWIVDLFIWKFTKTPRYFSFVLDPSK